MSSYWVYPPIQDEADARQQRCHNRSSGVDSPAFKTGLECPTKSSFQLLLSDACMNSGMIAAGSSKCIQVRQFRSKINLHFPQPLTVNTWFDLPVFSSSLLIFSNR